MHRLRVFWKRVAALSLVAVTLAWQTPAAWCQVPGDLAHGGPDLDLASSESNMSGAAMLGALINRGGSVRSIGAGDTLTAAEYVAAMQVLNTGRQDLHLNTAGSAMGGSFNLNALGLSNLASLNIPQSVAALTSVGGGTTNFNVSGLLHNAGTLGVTPDSVAGRLIINVGHLFVANTGVLSTALSGAGRVDLSIFSSGSVINLGSILSSGELSIVASETVQNRAGATMLGSSVNVSAGGAVSNAGLIQSTVGDVTFKNIGNGDFTLNNTGGLISAANNIAVSQFSGTTKATTFILGGDFSANNLNVNSGDGLAEISIGEINAVINVKGGAAHVAASTDKLRLGKLDLTGDPVIFNAGGDVELQNNVVFRGQSLAILARDSVTAKSGVNLIDLSGNAGNPNGGTLYVMAGWDVTQVPVGLSFEYQIGAPSTNGGNIELGAVNVRTGATAAGANGGGAHFYTRSGSLNSGKIELLSANTTATSGNGGRVEINGPGDILVNGSVTTTGRNSGGLVRVATGDPDALAVVFDNAGVLQSGTVSFNPGGNGPITMKGSITTSSTQGAGGNVIVAAGQTAEVYGSIVTGGKTNSGLVALTSDNADVIVRNTINSGSTLAGANGGSVQIAAAQNIEVGKDIITAAPNFGGPVGLVTNSSTPNNGDIRIGYNLRSVSPLLLNTTGGINTSSSGNEAGIVVIATNGTRGNVYVGKGINAVSKQGSVVSRVSITAADTVRMDGGINTSSSGTSGVGGGVVLTVNGGNDLFGLDLGGAVNTSGAQAGDVTINVNNGAALIRGAVTANGKGTGSVGADVSIFALQDLEVAGAINSSGGTAGSIELLAGDGGAVFGGGTMLIRGGLLANSTAVGSIGGNVDLDGFALLQINGNITTTGSGGGGIVTGSALGGTIVVNGTIDTSGLNNGTGNGGPAGDIILNGSFDGSAVRVSGSLKALGGSYTGPAANTFNGGNGGLVIINTIIDSGSGLPTGYAFIGGSVDTRGGSTKSAAGTPGNGGTVDLQAGTVQIMSASAGGASINATAGKNGSGGVGVSPQITVRTSSLQPIPSNLDLVSTKASEYALPGALFEIGNPTVNGTRGNIVSSNGTLTARRIIGPIAPNTVASIETLGDPSQEIDENGTNKVIYVLSGFAANAPRRLVTPGEALALYQVSRNSAQTIGLTGAGAVSFDAGLGPSFIDVQGYDFNKPLTSFNLQTADIPICGCGLDFNVHVSDQFPSVRIIMPTKLLTAAQLPEEFPGLPPAAYFNANFTFVDDDPGSFAKSARMDFAPAPVYIDNQEDGLFGSIGSIRADDDVMLTLANSGKSVWTNLGYIAAAALTIKTSGDYAMLMGDGSEIISSGTHDLKFFAGTGQRATGVLNIQNQNNTVGSTIDGYIVSMYANKLAFGTSDLGFNVNGPVLAGGGIRNLEGISGLSFNTPSVIDVAQFGHIWGGATTNVFSSGDMTLNDANVHGRSGVNLISTQDISLQGFNRLVSGTSMTIRAFDALRGNGDPQTIRAENGFLRLGGITDGVDLLGANKVYSKGAMNIFMQASAALPSSQIDGEFISDANITVGSLAALGVTHNGSVTVNGTLQAKQAVSIDGLVGVNIAGAVRSLTSQVTMTSSSGPVTTQIGSAVRGATGLSATSGAAIGMQGLIVADAGTLLLKTTNNGAIIVGGPTFAGTPGDNFNPASTAPVLRSDITSLGVINIQASGDVTIEGASLTSYGGDVRITSFGGNLVIDPDTDIFAYGGNVSILSANNVQAGPTAPATGVGPVIQALSLVNGAAFTGGGVEIKSGSTLSTVASVVANRPNPLSIQFNNNAGNVQNNVTGTRGRLLVGDGPGVTLTNNGAIANSLVLNGTNSVVLIEASGASVNALDSTSITSVTPVGALDSTAIDSNELMVDTEFDMEEGDLALAK